MLTLTPCSLSWRSKYTATSAPNRCSQTTLSGTAIVTSQPFIRADAAASTPMNPPPITPRCPFEASSMSARAWESSIVRIERAPGSSRGVAPVARTSRSYSTASPSESAMLLAPMSTAVALTPVRTSTSWLSHHSAGCM